ncbi:class F sortase [Microbacterium sp.]|uniref:class F sortase n=1 Tax=Microbacterium sp. TaxID=51671 RepID=UPI0025F9AFB8|nr:class F sortase [Microbacterium sp.]
MMSGRGLLGGSSIPAVVVAVSLLTGCSPATPSGVGPSAAVTPSPRPTAVLDVPVAPATAPPIVAPVEPVELRIDAIDAVLPVEPVGVKSDGSMDIPTLPSEAGWYRYGPTPGAPEGSSVLAAHVDSRVYGVGPLGRLRELPLGSIVQVADAEGVARSFEVISVTYIPRAELPVSDFFSRTGERKLVIITCGGSFDEATRTYSDNVVAVARPLDA